MARILFTHGHLVVDDKKEYLDGALLVEDNRILDVYPHTNKIDNIPEAEIIDLKGKLVFPGFFDVLSIKDLKEIESFTSKGVSSFVLSIDLNNILNMQNINYLKNSGFKGFSLKEENILKERKAEEIIEQLKGIDDLKEVELNPIYADTSELIEHLKRMNIKVMFGKTAASYEDIKDYYHDGFSDIYSKPSYFSFEKPGLINMALDERDKYLKVDAGADTSALRLLKDINDKDKLVVTSKDKQSQIIDGLKAMKKMGAKNTELLAYSSLNNYRLYNLDKRFGSLIKGRNADVVVVNDDLDIEFSYIRGKIVNV